MKKAILSVMLILMAILLLSSVKAWSADYPDIGPLPERKAPNPKAGVCKSLFLMPDYPRCC